MKLENQVVSLELAKRLKELGVKGSSVFWWLNLADGWKVLYYDFASEYDPINPIQAWTVAELGEMLPETVSSGKTWGGGYRALFVSDAHKIIHQEDAPTEADARAKMLIHLLENKLITVEEVTARLHPVEGKGKS